MNGINDTGFTSFGAAATDFFNELTKGRKVEQLPCAGCGETTTVLDDATPECLACMRVRTDKEQAEKHRAIYLEALPSRLPKRYRWARFDSPLLAERVKDARAVAAVKETIGSDEPIVTLIGPAGVGKTVLTSCALIAEAEAADRAHRGRRIDIMFCDALELARARSAHRLGDDEPDVLQQARAAKVLALDDVGQEQGADFIAATIRDLVFDRFANEMRTYVTTGLQPEQIATRYGDGFARRLFERCAIRLGARGTK